MVMVRLGIAVAPMTARSGGASLRSNDSEPSEASARLPRRNRQDEEEKFGKLKFQILPFKGEIDPEA